MRSHEAVVPAGCGRIRRARYPVSFAGWPSTARRAARQPLRRPAVELPKEVVPVAHVYAPPADITRRWLVIDAEGAILGRMSTEIATLLRGKHKPIWAPHVDTGDHVIVINASKLAIDPKKATDKLYHRHTGYPGGIRTESLEHLLGPRHRAGRAARRAPHAARRARSGARC